MAKKKEKKHIRLFTDQGFEEGAIEIFAQYEPGPVYVQSTETPDGPGLYICDVPFTIEEADAQHEAIFDDLPGEEDSLDVLDDAEPLDVVGEVEEQE